MPRFQDEQPYAVNNAKYLALLLIFFGAVLGIVYLCTEELVVRKLVLSLALPVGFCWLGLLTITYFLIVNNRKWLGLICMFLTLVFSLSGNQVLKQSLAQSLEYEFSEFSVEQSEEFDVIVLLGGGTGYGIHGQSQLGSSGDRVMVALQMFENGKAKKIVCTGSSIAALANSEKPAPREQSKEILVRAGVPDEKIELVEGRTTAEEMESLSKMFRDSKLKIGIISSAWHLPRVMRLAAKHDVKAHPIPSDFLAGESRLSILSIVPSAGAMAANTKLIKELIAKSAGQ